MLYFAELVNQDIHPNIENHLNYHQIKSIADLDEVIKSGNFRFNTRIVKYILNCDFNSFLLFMERQTEEFITELYNLSLGNSYHTIESYSKNLNFIKNYLKNKNYKLI